MHQTSEIIILFIIACSFALMHIYLPRFFNKTQSTLLFSASFGGGLAITYVFLQLLPELDNSREIAGNSIHFVTLLGFMVFFVMEHVAFRLSEKTRTTHEIVHYSFFIRLTFTWLYNWLLAFTLLEYVHESLFSTLIYLLVLIVHVMHNDHALHKHNPQHYMQWGRYSLALAPLLGWLASIMLTTNQLIAELLIATLAGFVIFRVFNEELPKQQHTNIKVFIAGVVISAMLLQLVKVVALQSVTQIANL